MDGDLSKHVVLVTGEAVGVKNTLKRTKVATWQSGYTYRAAA